MYRIINENVRQNCINELKSLPLGKWQVEIKKAKRTNNQNSLYWKWLSVISNDLGYTEDELHEGFKANFIGQDNGRDMFGNIYIKPKSTTTLTTKEFSEYMNKIEVFAMGHELRLPQPDHYGYERNNNDPTGN